MCVYLFIIIICISIMLGFLKESYDVSDIMIDIYKYLKFVLSKFLL